VIREARAKLANTTTTAYISPPAPVLSRWREVTPSQTFVVSEDKHGTLPVNCSVPQGSVLGPIKFISENEDDDDDDDDERMYFNVA